MAKGCIVLVFNGWCMVHCAIYTIVKWRWERIGTPIFVFKLAQVFEYVIVTHCYSIFCNWSPRVIMIYGS